MIIHFHFHSRTTGVTKYIENIIPFLNRFSDAVVFGYGIEASKISFYSLLRLVYSNDKTIIHTHRNNEIIFALLLRILMGRFTLIFTRHAESKPSNFTCFLMKKADSLVSLTPYMAKSLPCKNTLIRHGVNTEIFKILEKKTIPNISQENLISVIGRLRPAKRQHVVLEALISPLRKNPDWGLLLIGKIDNKGYSEKILSVAQENGILSQVYIIPESDKIIEYYSASKAVVIASKSEGFSLVCLEAISCGLITVATESVGIHSEVIKHGENGFLFPVDDTKALSLLISDIMSKKIALNPEKIRQSIKETWSVEKSASELLKLYEITPGVTSK